MAAFSLRNPGTGTTHNSATSIQPLHLCGLTRQSERTTRTRRQTVLCLPLKEENGNFALCAYGAWASLFWFEYCGARRTLASDSMTFARFFDGSASRSGSEAATTFSIERSRIRLNKYAEFWFNINWQKRGNDEIRSHPVLEQRR